MSDKVIYDTGKTIFYEEGTNSLLAKTLNIAIKDSNSTKTVCREVWLQYYSDSLSNSEKGKKNIDKFNNSFKFCSSIIIKSNRLVTIPVFIGDIQAKLTADVIDYEIPLLLSKDPMKMANAMTDFKNDKMIMF